MTVWFLKFPPASPTLASQSSIPQAPSAACPRHPSTAHRPRPAPPLPQRRPSSRLTTTRVSSPGPSVSGPKFLPRRRITSLAPSTPRRHTADYTLSSCSLMALRMTLSGGNTGCDSSPARGTSSRFGIIILPKCAGLCHFGSNTQE